MTGTNANKRLTVLRRLTGGVLAIAALTALAFARAERREKLLGG